MVNQKKKSFLFGLLGAATAAGMVMGATGVISTFVEKPAEVNAAGDYYEQVTEMPEEGLSGQYLITCDDYGYILNGSLGSDSIDAKNNYLSIGSFSGTLAATAELAQAEFTITYEEEGYSILGTSGLYIYGTTSGGKLSSTTKLRDDNQISFVNGDAEISSNGSLLRYCKNSTSDRFRYYKASTASGANYIKVQLYKLVEGDEPDVPTISVSSTSLSLVSEEIRTLDVYYSDLTSPLEVESSNPEAVDVEFENQTEIVGSGAAKVDVYALAAADEPVTLTFSSDGATSVEVTVTVTEGVAFSKAENVSDIVDGMNVVIGFGNKMVLNAYESSNDRYNSAEAVFVSNNSVIKPVTGYLTFKIEAHSEGYSIFDNSQQMYLGVAYDSDGVDTGAIALSATLGEDYYWNIASAEGGSLKISPAATGERYFLQNNTTTGKSFVAVYLSNKSYLQPSFYSQELGSVTDEQRFATFGKLYLRADEELTGEYTGACVDHGYYARAKAALEGDWADVLPLLEADTTGLKDRYMAWAIANGELADLSGFKATYYTLNPNVSFSKKVTTAALSGLGVLAVGAAAAGVMIAVRKKKHE